MTERSNKSFTSGLNFNPRICATRLWSAVLPVVALLFLFPQQALAQDVPYAPTSCDMQLKITNQTPSVGVAAHPGDDITFQLTIKKRRPWGVGATIESCYGNRVWVRPWGSRTEAPPKPLGPFWNHEPYTFSPITSVAFGGGLWSRPGLGASISTLWGINLSDLEAFHTPLIPEFQQEVTIAIEQDRQPGTYPVCFTISLLHWDPPNEDYVDGQTVSWAGPIRGPDFEVGGPKNQARRENNSDCRDVIVAERKAGGDCHGDCEISCCDSTSTCLFSLPQFIDGCLITLKTFYLIVLGLLLLILLMLLFRRR